MSVAVVEEAPGYIQVLSDGSVKRFSPGETAAATSLDHAHGFKSKDVVICPLRPITARIFLPRDHNDNGSDELLPLVVYFHGGGFCVGSTAWPGYHRFLGGLSASAPCAVLSVDYSLAPEHPLPAAYDDSRAALAWARAQARLEPWLAAADLSRVFLAGDSAGANIAHNVALGAAGIIAGVIPIHPFFGSEARTAAEEADRGGAEAVASNDMFWRLSLPRGSDRDYPGCNFEVAAEEATWRDFPAAAVFVAGKDFLRERGVMYARFLEEKGVRGVRLFEAESESHVFHVFYPESEATVLLQSQMSEFINTNK